MQNFKALFSRELPKLEPYIDDFISIVNLLDTMGFDYQIDIASGAGFEYYTGMTFQLYKGEEKIGGGGRYDALVPLMGGRKVPASGFALYLDQLMNLLPRATSAMSPVHQILIKVDTDEPESLKESFTAAKCIREAGYVAELSLGAQQMAESRWTLTVQGKQPLFVLIDGITNKRFGVQTITEVLALLEETGAGKAGTT